MEEAVQVIGVGYIGSAIAGVLLEQGYTVHGIDTDTAVVNGIREGSPVHPGVQGPLVDALGDGFSIHDSYDDLPGGTHILCISTPTGADGTMDGTDLLAACRSLGTHLEQGETVIVRSTVEPGTSEERILPTLEDASGLTAGTDFGYCYQPEFLRGGAARSDLLDPQKTVLAGDDMAIERARELVPTGQSVFEVSLREAEAVKYLDNAFHALKVSFANEVLRWSDSEDLDAQRLMSILQSDTRLNASAAYLDPGYPFGGPCLEKDLQVIAHRTRQEDVPLLRNIQKSNEDHLRWLHGRIRESLQDGTVGLLGLAYKDGVHSTKGSPALRLEERLTNDGYTVIGHDPGVDEPGIDQLEDPEAVMDGADVVVVFNDTDAYRRIDPERTDTLVIDLRDLTGPDT